MPTSPSYRLWMGAVEKHLLVLCILGMGLSRRFNQKTPHHQKLAYKLLTGAGKTGDQSPNIPV